MHVKPGNMFSVIFMSLRYENFRMVKDVDVEIDLAGSLIRFVTEGRAAARTEAAPYSG